MPWNCSFQLWTIAFATVTTFILPLLCYGCQGRAIIDLTHTLADNGPEIPMNPVMFPHLALFSLGERGGSVVECRTPEWEVLSSRPTAAVLCPWARHFTPRKYWLITQEAMAPSRHDWKIVDWDVKPQHNQKLFSLRSESDNPDATCELSL